MLNALIALFGKLNVLVWGVSLTRAFLYSFIITATAAEGMDAIPQQWKLASKLFVIQAGVMLAFLDTTIAKLSALATSNNTKGN